MRGGVQKKENDMSDSNRKLKCVVPGCGHEMLEKDAFVPALKRLSVKFNRRPTREELAEFVMCRTCKEHFVSRKIAEAKAAGMDGIERMFYGFTEQAALIERLDAEAKARADAATAKFADLFGDIVRQVKPKAAAVAPVAQLPVVKPEAKPRGTKKAVAAAKAAS